MIPRATYRLQFHRGFTFDDATAIVPYLGQLGISHIYSSPILTARPGSLHGYDVIDHARINPELGGEPAFRHFCATLAKTKLKLIVDIVPNHMAVGAGNMWWQDVLERGRASPYAGFFDIDWYAFDGKILAPFLGASYAEELASGRIQLAHDEHAGKWSIRYYDHRFPLRREDYPEAAKQAHLSTDDMHQLLLRQNYRLCWWRTAADAINWRRFFNINDLAALRIDRPEVFEAVHEKTFALVGEGLIDGVRVDHVDGLADPAAYCRKLRDCLDALTDGGEQPYLVVEKILAPGEQLPQDWPTDGTTGYDFLNDVCALLHDGRGAQPLADAWHAVSRRSSDFESEERRAREGILVNTFYAPLAATASAFEAAAEATAYAPDITHVALMRALVCLVGGLRRYRTYATGRETCGDTDLRRAFDAARDGLKGTDIHALDVIAQTLAGELPADDMLLEDAVRRFNQLSASVAAKAVEDTAFYRYGRLLSRNDVGCAPQVFALSPSTFHDRAAARGAKFPHAMLATATHDHKRGEDTRARLAVIGERPAEWLLKVAHWFDCNKPLRPQGLDPGDEYQLYQTLTGAWPIALAPDDGPGLAAFADRIADWQIKFLREAKLRSSWRDPDEVYETRAIDFTRAILDPDRSREFLLSLHGFVAQIGPAAALNGLVQCTLRFTCPGVPDTFQGTEFWDFSLVDPDNRKAVDFAARMTALSDGAPLPDLLARWQNGHIKQAMIARLCALRARCPSLFASSSYQPLNILGRRSDNVVAFLRRHDKQVILVAVPRLCSEACIAAGKPLPTRTYWMDTAIEVAGSVREWMSMFGAQEIYRDRAILPCNSLFDQFPVAVMLGRS